MEAYRLSATEVLAALETDAERGLEESEAARRLQRCGRNELASERRPSRWRRLFVQLRDPLVILLLIAAAVSAALWLYERDGPLPYEAIAILAIVLINALMGFIQQTRAEQALDALRRISANTALVIRGAEQRRIDAAELVPGDILLVEAGDTVPADARLIESTQLRTTEAALTGESLPVAKDTAPLAETPAIGDRINMLFSGTAVIHGHGKAVVTATGMATHMGRIAGMLRETPEEKTPLQQELARIGRLLGLAVIAIAALMIAAIVLLQEVRGISALFDVLIFGVALAVAAVPEGLPAVVTAVLALGVQRMARRNAIVRHLAAVETLGSANVIATDKTGTLTRNEMTVRVVVTASGCARFGGVGYAPEGEVQYEHGADRAALQSELYRALAVGDRANNASLHEQNGAWRVEGDPTEGALLVAARKAGLSDEEFDRRFHRVGEIPFSSERKLMTTLHTDAQHRERLLAFTKGAPDTLLARCSHELVGTEAVKLTAERRGQILRTNDDLAKQALRTLGVAYRELPAGSAGPRDESIEQDLVFAGLIGMIDPPRPEARAAVGRAHAAGIRTLMVTGDHPTTGVVVARELGIARDEGVLTGAQLERMDESALSEAVRETAVYARVNPEHKLRIVRALQRQGAVVAVTGDGVNDAPALRAADIGVAMGRGGTEVSRQAADIVLADDNYATIVAAVEEGRTIFGNIRKFLHYLLATNIGEVVTMFFGVLLAGVIGLQAHGEGGIVLPLMATQILWINLVTDGAPALALGLDPADEQAMRRPPRLQGERIITGRMWGGILASGAIMAAGTLFVLSVSLSRAGAEGMRYAHTMAFTTLVFFSLFMVFNARSPRRSAFRGLFANRWLWGAVLLSLALQAAAVYVPFLQQAFFTTALSGTDWLMCAAVGSSVLWLHELAKLPYRLRGRNMLQ